ncbi:Rrf2 family transcriptional regulator [Streptomyces cadmiisoli]|uniref:Rrf2 family transcriptional regulator n=1 Tax=Streptomyces cadmiisoli TaxID=2184053 RepID=UPI003D70B1C0
MGRASLVNAACLPGDEPVPTVQLAAAHDLSPSYLNKVLQCLVRAGILQSMSGLQGACRWLAPWRRFRCWP